MQTEGGTIEFFFKPLKEDPLREDKYQDMIFIKEHINETCWK